MNNLKDKYSHRSFEGHPAYRNGILRVFIPGDGSYILIPKTDKEYVFPNWPGYSLRFTTDKSNSTIKYLEYITPEGVMRLK